jgi:hypothetical protein
MRVVPLRPSPVMKIGFSIGIWYLARLGTTGSLEGLVLMPSDITQKMDWSIQGIGRASYFSTVRDCSGVVLKPAGFLSAAPLLPTHV